MRRLHQYVLSEAKSMVASAVVNCIWAINTIHLPTGARAWEVCFNHNRFESLLISKLDAWQAVDSLTLENILDRPASSKCGPNKVKKVLWGAPGV